MASSSQQLRFDITGDASKAAEAFSETADTADLAARGARLLAVALEAQKEAAKGSVDASISLAKADILASEAEDALRDKAVESAVALRAEGDEAKRAQDKNDSFFKRLGNGIESLASSGGGIPLIGGLIGKLASTGPAGAVSALAAVAGIIGALVTEVVALGTGLVAAGLGLGSLAVLALPTFKSITSALSDTNAELKKQPKPIQDAVAGIDKLKGEYLSMSAAIQPQLMQIFNTGLGIAAQLMPYVGQFAKAAAPAVEQFMTALSKKLDSQGFRDFMEKMEKLSPMVITELGKGVIQLSGDLAHLMEIMSNKDVINGFKAAFDALHVIIVIVGDVVKATIGTWEILTTAFKTGESVIETITHVVGEFATAISGAAHWVSNLGSTIPAALGSAGRWLYNAGGNIINGLINGLNSRLGGLLGMISNIGSEVSGAFAKMLRIGSPSLVFRQHGENIVAGLIQGIDTGMTQVSSAVRKLAGVTSANFAVSAAGGGSHSMNFTFTFEPTGNDLTDAIGKHVRVFVKGNGGAGANSAQKALGQRV